MLESDGLREAADEVWDRSSPHETSDSHGNRERESRLYVLKPGAHGVTRHTSIDQIYDHDLGSFNESA
jgi:hypothetical protein